MYAAEAYHTRGAIRHVVGVLQLHLSKTSLTVMDLWMSMIENWADANKVAAQCQHRAEICLPAMSKYLFRTFNAMKQIHFALLNPISVRNALNKTIKIYLSKSSIFGGEDDLEVLTGEMVRQYKGNPSGMPYNVMMRFLMKVGCNGMEQPQFEPLSKSCMDKIEKLVEVYDHLLVSTTNKPATEWVILLTTSGQVKIPPKIE